MKDPVRNMPRAIILSISTVTLIYILTNTAYFAVLTGPEILGSSAIAVTFGERTLSSVKWLMPLAVAFCTVGGLNGAIFTSSRVLFAGARQGQLFSALNMINPRYLTPIPDLIFLGIVSSFYLITTEIIMLINYTTFVEALFAALAVSTMLALRYKLPELDRPLKVSLLVPILYLIFSALFIILPIWTAPVEAAIGVLIVLTGVPAYYLTAHWSTKPAGYQKAMDSFNRFTQMLTYSVTPTEHVSLD